VSEWSTCQFASRLNFAPSSSSSNKFGLTLLPLLNGTPNLSDDGSEDEDSEHEVDDDERILSVSDRQRKVSDGRHCQRRPEERPLLDQC